MTPAEEYQLLAAAAKAGKRRVCAEAHFIKWAEGSQLRKYHLKRGEECHVELKNPRAHFYTHNMKWVKGPQTLEPAEVEPPRVLESPTRKQCSRCKKRKPVAEFYRSHPHTRDGYQAQCKACIKEQAKARYEKRTKK